MGGETTAHGRASQAESGATLWGAVQIHVSAALSPPCCGAISVAPRARCGMLPTQAGSLRV